MVLTSRNFVFLFDTGFKCGLGLTENTLISLDYDSLNTEADKDHYAYTLPTLFFLNVPLLFSFTDVFFKIDIDGTVRNPTVSKIE